MLAWAIDGASTLTEVPFTTYDGLSDAGWFARRLAQLLEEQFKKTSFSKAKLRSGLRILQEEYRHAASDIPPLWAWPVAAAIMVEIDQTAAKTKMTIYRYADCFELVSQEILPDANHPVSPASEPPPTYDLWKPFSGFQCHERYRGTANNPYTSAYCPRQRRPIPYLGHLPIDDQRAGDALGRVTRPTSVAAGAKGF